MGCELAKTLVEEGHQLTVVDQDAEKLEMVENQADLKTLCGNAANMIVLEKAQVFSADLVLCVTADDEVNMLACLLSRGLGAKRVVVRVKNPDYLAGRRYFYRKVLGCEFFISPEELASDEICKVVQEHSTLAVETFADGRVQMRRIRMEDEMLVVGKKVHELAMPELSLVVAIFRDDEIIIPSGETEILKGDQILVIGASENVDDVLKVFGSKHPPAKHVVIVGGGEVGLSVARKLSSRSYTLTLIEQDAEQALYLSEALPKVTIIKGDGMSVDLLKEERVDKADVLISACKEDEKNFIICQLARQLGVPKSIASVEKPDYINLFQKLGVDVSVSPRLVAAQRLIKYVKRQQVHSLAVLEEGKAEVLEFEVSETAKACGKKLSKLGMPKGSVLGIIVRGSEIYIPRGEAVIEPKDRVVVFTLEKNIPKIVKLFS